MRALREEKKLKQGDIHKRTGLLCCYISRVENGHTVPAVETLEKFARALEVPMYQLFYEGEQTLKLSGFTKGEFGNGMALGSRRKDARMVAKFCHWFSRMEKDDLGLVLSMAQKMARRNGV